MSVILFATFGIAQTTLTPVESCKARNRLTLGRLDRGAPFFNAIDRGAMGETQVLPYMLEMRTLGIKHVSADVAFEISKAKISLQDVGLSFSSNYYDFQKPWELADRSRSDRLAALNKSLKWPVYLEMLKMLQSIDVKDGSCGRVYLNLLDDECLPTVNPVPDVSFPCKTPSN